MGEHDFPTRSCVFCRGRARKCELIRFVWYFDGSRGRIVRDPDYKLEGRGLYMHPTFSCWCKMPEKKHWARAFRIDVEKIETENIHAVMDEIKNVVTGGAEETVRNLKKQPQKVRL